MESECSLPCSQQPATDSYPERDVFCPHEIPLRSVLILSVHLHLGLTSGLFPSFPTKMYAFLYSPMSANLLINDYEIISGGFPTCMSWNRTVGRSEHWSCIWVASELHRLMQNFFIQWMLLINAVSTRNSPHTCTWYRRTQNFATVVHMRGHSGAFPTFTVATDAMWERLHDHKWN